MTVERGINYYHYIDKIVSPQYDLNNYIHPQITKPIIYETPPDYNQFVHSANSQIGADSSVDSNIALRTLYTGQQLKRMFDAKNSLIKLDRHRFFETELKDNENRIWWEEQKNFDSYDRMYNYNKRKQYNDGPFVPHIYGMN